MPPSASAITSSVRDGRWRLARRTLARRRDYRHIGVHAEDAVLSRSRIAAGVVPSSTSRCGVLPASALTIAANRCRLTMRRAPSSIATANVRSSASFAEGANRVVLPRRSRADGGGTGRLVSMPTAARADLKLAVAGRSDRVGADPGVNQRLSDRIADRIHECGQEMLRLHHGCPLRFSDLCSPADNFSGLSGKPLEHGSLLISVGWPDAMAVLLLDCLARYL